MIKAITIKADDELIAKGIKKARCEITTLDDKFQQWLEQYVGIGEIELSYYELMDHFKHVNVGRKLSRDELNKR